MRSPLRRVPSAPALPSASAPAGPEEGAATLNSGLPRVETRACWICHAADDTEDVPAAVLEDDSSRTAALFLRDASVSTGPLRGGFCDCRGSMGVVHETCLAQLIGQQGLTACLNCGAAYRFEEYHKTAHVPERPRDAFSRLLFLVRYFFAPLFAAFVWIGVQAWLALGLLPWSLGALYHARHGDASDAPIWRSWAVGMATLIALRMLRSAYKSYVLFFEEPEDEAAH
jgi:hypothetical protein